MGRWKECFCKGQSNGKVKNTFIIEYINSNIQLTPISLYSELINVIPRCTDFTLPFNFKYYFKMLRRGGRLSAPLSIKRTFSIHTFLENLKQTNINRKRKIFLFLCVSSTLSQKLYSISLFQRVLFRNR